MPLTGSINWWYSNLLASAGESKDVLHRLLSSGVSGTYESACQAGRAGFPDEARSYTLQASSDLWSLGRWCLPINTDESLSFDEAVAWAKKHVIDVYVVLLTDLTFFVRGGRISKTAGLRRHA